MLIDVDVEKELVSRGRSFRLKAAFSSEEQFVVLFGMAAERARGRQFSPPRFQQIVFFMVSCAVGLHIQGIIFAVTAG